MLKIRQVEFKSAVLLLAVLFAMPKVTSQVPNTISYQGILTTSDVPPELVDDGSYNLTFSLYLAELGGTPLWTESHTGVSVYQGRFHVILGSEETLGSVAFDAPYWMGVTVNDGEELPRIEFTSSAYSLNARAVQDDAVTSSSVQDGSLEFVDIGQNGASKGQMMVWDGGAWIASNSQYADSTDAITDGGVDFADIGQNGATEGQMMVWDGAAWIASNIAYADSTDAITDGGVDFADIGQNGAADGQVMKWNGTAWVASEDNTGDGSGPYLPLAGGTMTGPITSTGDPAITMGKGNFGTANTNTGSNSFVAGWNNEASGSISTVSGGQNNRAAAVGATVGGGRGNVAGAVGTSGQTIGGGYDNVTSAGRATIAGGTQNSAAGAGASIGGGYKNVAQGEGSTIGGGEEHVAGNWSSIGGGYRNRATGNFAVVAGGGGLISSSDSNLASGDFSAIGGGYNNAATGDSSSVAGGASNIASGTTAVVGGGYGNQANQSASTIGGGGLNIASGDFATVAGGMENHATGTQAMIGGGADNIADTIGATIGGGGYNRARGRYAVVSGGGGEFPADSNSATGNYSSVGGGRANAAMNDYSTIGGGKENVAENIATTVSGGSMNHANNAAATVGGGSENVAGGFYATVGGGRLNLASNDASTVGGGRSNFASGESATVIGGKENSADGFAATVLGGMENAARGNYSLAAGRRAKALHAGAVVLSAIDVHGVSNDSVWSGGDEQMVFRAIGGLYITNAPGAVASPYDPSNIITTRGGAYLSGNGTTWTNSSDRNAKENFAPLDRKDLLERIASLPINRWNYKDERDDITHIGPVAQDFHALFNVGENDKSISTIDPSGIALAAIQELYKQTREIDQLRDQMARMQEMIDALMAERP